MHFGPWRILSIIAVFILLLPLPALCLAANPTAPSESDIPLFVSRSPIPRAQSVDLHIVLTTNHALVLRVMIGAQWAN